MAEIEFSALSRSCLKRRNPDADALQRQITAYERRNPDADALQRQITAYQSEQRASPSTGGSAPTTPEPNSTAFTHAFPTLTEYQR